MGEKNINRKYKWNFRVERTLPFNCKPPFLLLMTKAPEGLVICLTLGTRTRAPENSLLPLPHANHFIIKFFAQNSPTWTINRRQLICTLEKLMCSVLIVCSGLF